jgi:hypothetical protein
MSGCWTNGSIAPGWIPSAQNVSMIPMTSYQDARRVS